MSSKLCIRDIKNILEEKKSSLLFDLFNEINKYIDFDEEQIIYLINYDTSDNYLLNNYFYKRLEIRYKDEIKEYLSKIVLNFLPMGNPDTGTTDIISDDDRIDIEMFAKLLKIYINLKNDLRLIIKKNYSINLIIDELEFKLSKEKNILEKIITKINLNEELIEDNQIISKFKSEIEKKLTKLNRINKSVLKTLFIDDEDYNKQREKLIKILNSLLVLIDTFIAIVINFGFIRKIKDKNQIEKLSEFFYNEGNYAINCYLNTISETIDDTNPEASVDINKNYNQNFKIQKKIYYNIINDLNNNEKIQKYYISIAKYLKDFEKLDKISIIAYYKKIINDIEYLEKIKPKPTKSLTISTKISKLTKSILISTGLRKQKKRDILQRLQIFNFNKEIKERNNLKIKQLISKLDDISWEYWERPEINIIENVKNYINIKKDNLVVNKSIEELFDNDYIPSMTTQEYKDFFNKIKINLTEYSKFFKEEENKKQNYYMLKKNYEYFFNDNKKNGIPSITNYIGNSLISLFVRYIENDKNLKFVDSSDAYVCNYIISKNEKGEFKDERQIGIDLDGLRRNFITSLTTELFQKKIFITREDTKSYFLNPNYQPDEYEKYIIKKHLSNIDDTYYESSKFIVDFYKFLGLLISFIIVNDCGLDYYLSSYLTSLFFNNDNDNINNLIYMINDFPSNFKMFANLMKKPNDINCGITFNDTYDLIPEDKDLDKDNIIEYLYEISKFINKKSIFRKDIEISSTITIEKQKQLIKTNTLMYISFNEGIPKQIKDDFTNNNFTPLIIKTYLKTPDMSNEIIEKLINNFSESMEEKYELEKIKEIFIEYVLKDNKEKHKNEKSYFKFITKLLNFWSASTFYKEDGKYKIEINSNLSINHLPQSHTCFYTIDIPDYSVLEKDEEIGNKLFDSINNAIFNIEEGFGLAGGAKKRGGRNKRMK